MDIDAPPQSGGTMELLSFRLGADEYCLDIMSVREIRGWSRPTPLPHAAPHMRGVLNLRGTILPIVDLSIRLGMAGVSGDPRNVFIVVGHGGLLTGLLVDSVSDILTVPRSDLHPPPDIAHYADQTFIGALAVIGGRMIRLLNLAAVLPAPPAEAPPRPPS
ncbi:chemotaxis protein CheW [Paenirhodobacter populi]|uniref:Purine-binding chemotaxis protein CheW n=1 Tax=Paenirhodobacter populi TaxID=2306993 RepID=A0A443JU80_9RHOB|nr:chemotaxis protein CheW [Sinirhodobacter populi]RWR24054.1 purine-binding chemotaxis protein CheW [Sinirhodobacter populi]